MTTTSMRRCVLVLVLIALLPCAAHANPFQRGMKNKNRDASPEQKEEAAAAITCDAMMAKSLVTANEAKAAAEQERDKYMSKLEKMTMRAYELQKELDDVASDLTKRLQEANERTSEIKKESKEALEKGEAEWKQLRTQYGNQMAMLREKTELALSDAKVEAQTTIANLNKTHSLQLTQKEMQVAGIKKDSQELIKAIREEAANNVTMIQTQRDETITELNRQHALEVNSLKREMSNQQKQHQQEMESTQRQAQESIEKMKRESIHEIAVTKAEAKTKLEGSVLQLAAVDEQRKAAEKERDGLDRKLRKATQEIARWESLYGSRSYCNFTYIHEDAMATAKATQQVVSDRATKATKQFYDVSAKAAEPHFQKSRQLYQKHVQPHVDKTHGLYKQHVKPHVDQHVVPFHKGYVKPVLKKLGALLKTLWVEIKACARGAHGQLVASYKATCPKTLKQLQELEAPPFMVTRVTQSCQDAETTVNTFLWGILFLLVFMFRIVLWQTVVGIVLWPIRIVWYFSPLRLLLGLCKKRRTAAAEQDHDGINGNGEVVPDTITSQPTKKKKKLPPSQ